MKTGLACLAFALTLPLAQTRAVSDPLDDLLARGRTAQASVTSLSASFTETTVSSLLRDPIVAKGTLVAAKPVRVILRYADGKTMLVDATRLVVDWPAHHQHEELNIVETQKRVQQYFVDASSQELRKSFDIVLSTDRDLHDAHRLDMTPKRKQIKEGMQRLRLWIQPATLTLIKMRIDYPGGDSRTLELQDIRLNVPIDDRTFVIR